MNIDYDLYVIDPANTNSTWGQLRDCIHDALKILDERTRHIIELEDKILGNLIKNAEEVK